MKGSNSCMILLRVEDLGRQIHQRWLWRGVSFELKPQMRLGLVGPSGSGKTLLLRTLVNLDPIQEGKIFWAGRSISEWPLPIYRTQVMYLPQRSALFEGTVEQNLQMIFHLSSHRNRSYNLARIQSYLRTLDRDEQFLSLSATQLSGGERQILSILRVLQLDPQILLLDEPTASLDPKSTYQVEALIDDWLRSNPSRACMWTSHDPDQMDRVTQDRFDISRSLIDYAS